MKPRIVFAGTPEFAALHLKTLMQDPRFELVAVYTQPDRPAGRGRHLSASPVKALANIQHLPVYQPTSLKNTVAQQQLAALQPDIMVVVAYGLLLPAAVLNIPRYGCINVHASLLPRWRGAAPIQRAILAGDSTTGISIMQMDTGLDTGPVLQQLSCVITPQETSASLHNKLAELGSNTLPKALCAVTNNQLHSLPQNTTEVTYAHKITKAEAEIQWQSSAVYIDQQVRAFNPWPVAFTYLNGAPLRIWQGTRLQTAASAPAGTVVKLSKAGIEIACGDQLYCIEQLQLPGGKAMSAQALLNAHKSQWQPGLHLG